MAMLSVLLVDAAAERRQLLMALLDKPCELSDVGDASAAVSEVERRHFDIILLGPCPDDAAALEFCRKFYGHQIALTDPFYRHTVTVVMSTDTALDGRLRAYEAGAEDYLYLDAANEQLQAKLDAIFDYHAEHKRHHRELKQQARKLVGEDYLTRHDHKVFIHFVQSCRSAPDIQTLGGALDNLMHCWGLDYIARLDVAHRGECYFHGHNQPTCPLEKNLFAALNSPEASIKSFGVRSYFQSGSAALMVKNMPPAEDRSHHRLLGLLHLVVEILDDRRRELESIQALEAVQLRLSALSTALCNGELIGLADLLALELKRLGGCGGVASDEDEQQLL